MITITNIADENIRVPKAWGDEIIIHNGEDYCGKILRFKKNAKFSLHFHSKKTETWIINKGLFSLITIDTRIAARQTITLTEGDIIHIEPNTPHQLIALEYGEIFECSTPHYDDDSYRIEKGDSQL
jgi:mannose-6-phosphate isomerase-like protein (cupin superfamily)